MNLAKLKLLFHTVKHLRWQQVYYRLYYTIRNRFFKKNYNKTLNKTTESLEWKNSVSFKNSYLQNQTFTFLNIQHEFDEEVDWNLNSYGKLWTYNLNYFDFLNQKKIEVKNGLSLINSYLDYESLLKDGLEPYPISLRGINWIKFLSLHKINDHKIDQSLYNQYQILLRNLEYHLLGNHLLENGFSLFFGSFYFKDDKMYHRAIQILNNQLSEQIHKDGGHFELSTMYHQILLHRILDCIQLVKLNAWKDGGILEFLTGFAEKMLSWLAAVTFDNGDIPLVNDSAKNIALSSSQLFNYAQLLELTWEAKTLSDSGYRTYKDGKIELFGDIGQLAVDYQPGHAHADTLSFVLHVDGKPLIIDPGISTYEINDDRKLERATQFHNTVCPLDRSNSSQVWSGFRVAKRAEVRILSEGENNITASHNGYSSTHQRSFSLNNSLMIHDVLKNSDGIAYFHLTPDCTIEFKESDNLVLVNGVQIQFSKYTELTIEDYLCPMGYNKTQPAKKIVVIFKESLTTEISILST